MSHFPTREEAWKLLLEYVSGEGLQRHALAVEAVMRHMARRRGQPLRSSCQAAGSLPQRLARKVL